METILINNKEYSVVSTIEKMTVADSFVVRSNKIGAGNGEAKFYIGNEGDEIRTFFGDIGFNNQCFLFKRDLIKYLYDCEIEYKKPEQEYRDKNNMPGLWQKRLSDVLKMDDILFF